MGTSVITGGLLEDNLVLPHYLDNMVSLISFNYNGFYDFKTHQWISAIVMNF